MERIFVADTHTIRINYLNVLSLFHKARRAKFIIRKRLRPEDRGKKNPTEISKLCGHPSKSTYQKIRSW